MAGDALTPSALWAQRSSSIFLTICLDDCTSPDIQIKPDSLTFSGVGGVDKKLNKLVINFYGEIDPEKSLQSVRGRNIEFVFKKIKDGYWPHLTKEKIKHHWLKVDFNKWKDEDESEDEEGLGGVEQDDDLESMMKRMGSLQGPGDGGKPNLDELNMDSEDSDDNNEMPELE